MPRPLLDETRTAKESAERALAEQSVAERSEQARASAGIEDLRRALPPGSALLSYVRYERTPISPTAGAGRASVASYIAFVMRGDTGAVTAVPLGSASLIDGLIREWRGEGLKGAA